MASESTSASLRENLSTAVQPLTRWQWALYILILCFAAVVRLAYLDRIPPGLWYDEAIYAMDGYDVSRGKWAIFFPTYGHMREPLYIWSLGGFFSLFGHSTLHARIVSALWGIATVAIFFPVARRPLGNRWALLATFAFASFRWHLHFSRTIFRALLPSFFMLALVLAILRWRERRRPVDAALAGFVMGLGAYTYLSWRMVPLVLAGWAAFLVWQGDLRLRRDGRHLALMIGTALVVFLPLGLDYLRNPVHFTGRTDEISVFEKTIQVQGADGQTLEQRVPKTWFEAGRDLAVQAGQVASMWTFRGDHVAKHNLPHAPVFDWASGLLFYLGLAWCALNLRRETIAPLLLLWLFFFALTSVFSFGAPNLLRMQGASPAAVLVYVLGLRWAAGLLARVASKPVQIGAITALVLLFAGHQLFVYFVKFPRSLAVRREFLADTFYIPSEAVRNVAEQGVPVYVPEEMTGDSTPTFQFVTAGLENVRPYSPSDDLATSLTQPAAVLLTMRSLQLAGSQGTDHLSRLTQLPGAKRIWRSTLPMEGASPEAPWRHMQWSELWTVRGADVNPPAPPRY